ncbi:MAG: HDIG domain-containing protein [Deltaproteobacteria bacterium]|nr:HDIG domain-containing protein [Deltaproteobacteria bacterium]
MNREKALELLNTYISNQNLIKHSLATESCMRSLASRFGEDPEKWGLCGLIHDIDYEVVNGDMKRHSLEGVRILKKHGFDDDICQAVLSHNEAHGVVPASRMAKALYCVDPITGLIVAATLVLPSKKISHLKPENLLNRFKEKSFAKGVRREVILKCKEYLDIELETFSDICIKAMNTIAEDLGL